MSGKYSCFSRRNIIMLLRSWQPISLGDAKPLSCKTTASDQDSYNASVTTMPQTSARSHKPAYISIDPPIHTLRLPAEIAKTNFIHQIKHETKV